jgi:hypothetical protein
MSVDASPRDRPHGQAWRLHVARLMPELRSRADDLCELCGAPIDFDAPARSSMSASVDHVVPVHAGGAHLPPVDELRLAHYGCNSRRGNRTRARGAAAPVAVRSAVELMPEAEPRARDYERFRVGRRGDHSLADHPSLFDVDELALAPTRPRSFRDPLTRRQSGNPLSPFVHQFSGERVELVPPRLETGRPFDVTGSYGAEAAGWIGAYLRDELRPWQRYALERLLEHRADGSLRWRRVILTVSRQSGKSILSRGLCGWRVGAADLFDEPQEVLHVANLRATAQRIWTPAARTLEETLGAVVRRSNGQEAIELVDGSAWRLAASTLDGGVGSSVSLAFVDEAWRISREVVDGSIAPTMLERRSPQLVLVSTAGDGGSKLLIEDRDAAIAQLHDPDTARILILEWSAPPEAYPDDRDAWRQASPHWTPQRREALEHAYATATETEWRRQYLNQWVLAARSWIGPAHWNAAGAAELQLPASPAGTLAINDEDGRPGACGYALAVADKDGNVVLTGRAFPSRRALWAALEELTRARRGVELLYPASFAQHVARLSGVTATKVGTAEQRAGYGPTLAAIVDGRLRHDQDQELTRQMLTATPVTIPDVGTTLSARRSPGPIYLARAAVWAVGHELRPDRRRPPMIISG